jgi:hypothetical protein
MVRDGADAPPHAACQIAVIPGRCKASNYGTQLRTRESRGEGKNRRKPISRFRVRRGAPPRNDGVWCFDVVARLASWFETARMRLLTTRVDEHALGRFLRHCERSAAIQDQGKTACVTPGLLRSARDDVDTDVTLCSRGTICPSYSDEPPSNIIRGRREGRVPARTHGPLCSEKAQGQEPQVWPITGLPCAMVLRLIRDLPGDQALLSPSSVDRSTDLTPASGRQDHTISPSAATSLVVSSCCVHRIPRSTSVTIAIRPSCRGGTRQGKTPFAPTEKPIIFLI